MKIIILFTTLVVAFLFIKATIKSNKTVDANEGIKFFDGSMQEALELAKKEDKLIFLDACASWCGPCKSMQKKVFPMTKVGEFYNENFINLKIDMEKGEGIELSEKYEVKAYPSLFIIDHNGMPKMSAVGYHNANQLVKFGKEALK